MKAKHNLIYVPGIGDHKNRGEQQGLAIFRLFGITPHFHRMNWNDGSFAPKLAVLLAEIDTYVVRGEAVSLMGFSAGASAALNAYAERKDAVAAVVCISGKIQRPENIGERIKNQNPAFIESMALLQSNLAMFTPTEKSRILSIHPLTDKSVATRDTIIPGAQEQTIPVHGHAAAIGYGLIIDAPFISRFMKRLVR